MTERLIIGMSGASGAPLTVELLRQLHTFYPQIETHLVVTRGGEMTLREETDLTLEDLKTLAAVYHDNDNIGASIASGSFRTMGMAIVPCSMKTVAGIVSGYSDNLLLRAADVCMKERRKLVLVPRESPLSTLHLRNLCEASQLGAVVLPPMQTYYDHPQTAEDMTRHTVKRILSRFGLESGMREWTGMDTQHRDM
ncbi:MAG: UbiX family flavin prenyltransferase [Lachnospiraceae bacterium]|nr:UbiX family flavin prenyltransferase [Lachnospiraceae bacterium]